MLQFIVWDKVYNKVWDDSSSERYFIIFNERYDVHFRLDGSLEVVQRWTLHSDQYVLIPKSDFEIYFPANKEKMKKNYSKPFLKPRSGKSVVARYTHYTHDYVLRKYQNTTLMKRKLLIFRERKAALDLRGHA